MQAAKLDLEFDKDSWLRAEFHLVNKEGELIYPVEKQYRFIAKESLETEVELFNQIMPIIDGEGDFWLTKIEIYKEASDVEADLLHYVVREESTEEGNEDSDEILVYGTIKMNKRI